MIVLRAVSVAPDGAETPLGEVRLTGEGAVYSHLVESGADGHAVVLDVVERLRTATPKTRRQARSADAPFPIVVRPVCPCCDEYYTPGNHRCPGWV